MEWVPEQEEIGVCLYTNEMDRREEGERASMGERNGRYDSLR